MTLANESISRSNVLDDFQWNPEPAAEAWVREHVQYVLNRIPEAKAYAERLYKESGNRFADIVRSIGVPREQSASLAACKKAGWSEVATDQLVHPGGVFPIVTLSDSGSVEIVTKCDRVSDYLAANNLERDILGEPGAAYRWASLYASPASAEWLVAESHGSTPRNWSADAQALSKIIRAEESFRIRERKHDTTEAGFAHAEKLVDRAIDLVGRDYACDLFFAGEREYWMRRNRAAQVQYARQQRVGLGWANHDHHTYRCSREHFARLIAIWEKLGFVCRERFYAGAEAGWGAQVMEHPVTGIVTFNDVDLSPDELMQDFAHDPLEPRKDLGTVGLWCALHGESFLEAGMHHLECMFDFDALKQQLETEHAVKVMKPFTDFPHLRQAFTEGERWKVEPSKIDRLLKDGRITIEQGQKFRADGAIGSHLENLERNAGFKGFNQKGVSEIISATDPRKQ